MTTTQELLKSSFEPNLNNYGPEDVERLNDWAIKAYAALDALQAEVERLTIDRRVLQADGNHPAPCAKFCEATAFTIELRRAQAEIKVQTRAADHWMAEAKLAQPPAPSDTAITYMTGYSDGKEWAQTSQAVVVEPVYQYQLANGNWIDQTKESYDYNVKHGQATVRMLYATPQAAPLYAKEQQ